MPRDGEMEAERSTETESSPRHRDGGRVGERRRGRDKEIDRDIRRWRRRDTPRGRGTADPERHQRQTERWRHTQRQSQTPGRASPREGRGRRRRGRLRQRTDAGTSSPRRPQDRRGQGRDRRLPARDGWTGQVASLSAAGRAGLQGCAGTRRRLLLAPGPEPPAEAPPRPGRARPH